MINKIPPALLAVFVCVLFCMTGCGGREQVNTVTTDNVTSGDLAVSDDEVPETKVISEESGVVNIAGYIADIPGLDTVIKDFNECYPNISINYTDVTEMFAEEETEIEAGEGVHDAFYRRALDRVFNASADIFISNKILFESGNDIDVEVVDLNETSVDMGGINPILADQASDGEYCYGVPLYADVSGLLVNKTVLEEYGLELPSEYVEFIMACSALKNEGISALAADLDGENLNELMTDLLVSELDENDNIEEAVYSLNNAEEYAGDYLTESFELLGFLKKKRYLDINLCRDITDSDDALQRLVSGEYVFMPADYHMASKVLAENPDLAFIPNPLGSDGANVCVRSDAWLGLNSKGENRETAEIFLNFLCSKEELDAVAAETGRVSSASESFVACFDGAFSGVSVYGDPGISSRVMGIYSDMLREVAEGHLTVSGAADRFDKKNAESLKICKRIGKGKKIKKKDNKQETDDNNEDEEVMAENEASYESANVPKSE